MEAELYVHHATIALRESSDFQSSHCRSVHPIGFIHPHLLLTRFLLSIHCSARSVMRMLPACIALLFASMPCSICPAQSRVNSPVFRDYRPPVKSSVRPDMGEQWNAFLLVRKANAGDAVAQHDLGLRYLLGEGFAADTIRALYWIQKAAGQNLVTAQYNYGLLLLSGAGGMWNPFEAFELLRSAAERDLPEAQYMYGLQFTDNLIVRRDWLTAWRWLQKASRNDYEPARPIIEELFSRRYLLPEDTVTAVADTISESAAAPSRARKMPLSGKNPSQARTWSPLFLDFRPDSLRARIDSAALLTEALATCRLAPEDSADLARIFDSRDTMTSALAAALNAASVAGNPEASLLLAYFHARGNNLLRNERDAAILAIRAIWLDSPMAPLLLQELCQRESFVASLRRDALAEHPDAGYVWSQLVALDFARDITDRQAFEMLKDAAKQVYPDALLHLGMCFATGRWVRKDAETARDYWRHAAGAGSAEASVRLSASRLLGDSSTANPADISTLEEALSKGSIIAEVALARCYEVGRGVVQNIGESLRLYRHASMRGSKAAYRTLRALYDAERPEDPQFLIDETQQGD
jgi:uncharacterized protein